jgi:hypothetical protein
MSVPRFTRDQVVAAFSALGLSDREDISSIQISGTEIEVGLFVGDEDGTPIEVLGEYAQVYVTVPVEENL